MKQTLTLLTIMLALALASESQVAGSIAVVQAPSVAQCAWPSGFTAGTGTTAICITRTPVGIAVAIDGKLPFVSISNGGTATPTQLSCNATITQPLSALQIANGSATLTGTVSLTSCK